MNHPVPNWVGGDVFCLASGPSLTQNDIESVRLWRAQGNCRVIVVNSTFKWALWADALYSMDRSWWRSYQEEALGNFAGKCYSPISIGMPGFVHSLGITGFQGYGNSGAGAIMLAKWHKADRIFLLGYDCQLGAGGRTHFFGSHPKHLSDARSILKWPAQFKQVAKACKVPVWNCSPETALKMFKRMPLEDALRLPSQVAA